MRKKTRTQRADLKRVRLEWEHHSESTTRRQRQSCLSENHAEISHQNATGNHEIAVAYLQSLGRDEILFFFEYLVRSNSCEVWIHFNTLMAHSQLQLVKTYKQTSAGSKTVFSWDEHTLTVHSRRQLVKLATLSQRKKMLSWRPTSQLGFPAPTRYGHLVHHSRH